MKITAYVPDLIDRSKFSGLPAEFEVTFVSAPAGLGESEGDLVVADLSKPGVVEAMVLTNSRKIGFLSHIDGDTRTMAQAADVEVFARSRFFSRMVNILTKGDEEPADTYD